MREQDNIDATYVEFVAREITKIHEPTQCEDGLTLSQFADALVKSASPEARQRLAPELDRMVLRL